MQVQRLNVQELLPAKYIHLINDGKIMFAYTVPV